MKRMFQFAGLAVAFAVTLSAYLLASDVPENNSTIGLNSTIWTKQIPNPAAGGISVSSDKSKPDVTLSTFGPADMWAVRNDAPMLLTVAPKGNFAVETSVEYDQQRASAVAGISVCSNEANAVPRFTFGLDKWSGKTFVKLQGLPPAGNSPSIAVPVAETGKIWLRLECYRRSLTNKSEDLYIVLYKPQECAPWKQVAVLPENCVNDNICLFLKSNSKCSAVFSQITVSPLDEKMYKQQPQQVVDSEQIFSKIGKKQILFVSRPQYKPDHHNTATMFQTGEINMGSFRGSSALKMIDFSDGGLVKTLLQCPEGIIRDPDISFDGKRVLFSMRNNIKDDYHIYEMNLADKSVRQITSGEGLSDIDPAYLPSGKIVFSSTREPKYCMCNRHIMCNLYTMNADGSNMIQIGHSTLFEGHSSILADGRIVYDRWEYVDRNFGDAQGLWVTNPDGTSHLLYYGNNTGAPGGFLEAREIPGSTKAVCTLGSCHDRPWGAIAILDRSKGIEGQDGVLMTWPTDAFNRINVHGSYDAMRSLTVKFEDPYPLNEKQILCSGLIPGQGEKMGLYLLDTDGTSTLFYCEPQDSSQGCYDPMPIEPRPVPRVIEDRTDLTKKTGTFYLSDVYIGTGMDKIERGTVKWLRVVESPEKRFWSNGNWQGSGTQAPGMAWDDFNNKRILGTVPVETDGSANFEIPSDTFVYFQVLDEQGRMIQSMRSGTIVRPGENQGCIGCHEDRLNAVAPRNMPKALLRSPDKLKPWYGNPRTFSYTAEVQPVFDRNCIKCHDKGKPGAEKLCLAGDLTLAFNNSYQALRSSKKYVNVVGAGPAVVQQPRSWGSFVSPLAKVVLEGHGVPERDSQLHLTQEDKDRIITWIDINAPYYSEYSTPFPNNIFGRSPLTPNQLNKLNQLTGINCGQERNSNMVWFTRPELSPCLDKMDKKSAEYAEALSIIQDGKKKLEELGRADLPNCKLDAHEQAVQDKYDTRLKEEQQRVIKAAENQQ